MSLKYHFAPVARPFLVCIIIVAAALSSQAQCFDYANATGNPVITTFDLFPDGGINDVVLAGDIAWAARSTYGALVSIDISNPDLPVTIGVEQVTVMDETYSVSLSGSYAYLSYIQWGGLAGIRVFDITTPSDPVEVGGFDSTELGWVLGIEAVGDLLYVAYPSSGLGILDISTPEAPVLIGQAPLANAKEVSVAGNYAYVSNENFRPYVVDVSDPTNPTWVAWMTSTGGSRNMEIVGTLAYVATGTALDIIDISEPLTTALVGSIALPGIVYNVSISGNLAYVSCRENGVQVVDISDPQAPTLHGIVDIPGFPYTALASGDRLFSVSNSMIHIAPAQCSLEITSAQPVPVPEYLQLGVSPNPFNPRTTITFELTRTGQVELAVYDLLGRRIAVLHDGVLPEGRHTRAWEGHDEKGYPAAAGQYLVRLLSDNESIVRKVILAK